MKRPLYVASLLMLPGLVLFGVSPFAQAGDPEQGKKLYGQYCATCHGQGGKGDGPAAAALNPKPQDHTDKAYMSKLSDDELLKVIKEGGTSIGKSPIMPPWGTALKDDQIKDVIAYVRTLCCK